MSSNRSLIATLILFSALASNSSACHREDEEALLSFMASFPPNSFPTSWNSSSDCCTWDYVSCTAGRVTILQITDTPALRGPVPPSVARLSSLQFLILRNLPNLVAPLPNLARLRSLQFLIVSNTSLSGPVPSLLSRLPRLIALNLNDNLLSGPIPASLGGIPRLGLLYLSGNRLSGPIPNTLFGRAPKNASIQLDLSGNELTGPIPPSFGGLRFIQLDLSNNRLCGKIPSGKFLGQFDPSSFAHNDCLCGPPLAPCK